MGWSRAVVGSVVEKVRRIVVDQDVPVLRLREGIVDDLGRRAAGVDQRDLDSIAIVVDDVDPQLDIDDREAVRDVDEEVERGVAGGVQVIDEIATRTFVVTVDHLRDARGRNAEGEPDQETDCADGSRQTPRARARTKPHERATNGQKRGAKSKRGKQDFRKRIDLSLRHHSLIDNKK